MKITLDCPEGTCVMFVNYVFQSLDGILMGSKAIDTAMLVDGAEYKLMGKESGESDE